MKIRINDLARELEVKSKEILETLPKVGVTEKKTHSSSIEEDEAARVRKYILEQSQGGGREARLRVAPEESRPKIDLSRIAKPGDALKAIIQQKEHPPTAPARPPVVSARAAEPQKAPAAAPPRTAVTKPSAPPAARVETPAPEAPKPRLITPATVAPPRPPVIVPPAAKVEPKPVPVFGR